MFFIGCVTVDNTVNFKNLDLAIEKSCQNIQNDFNEKAIIAVVNIVSPSARLSDYIMEEAMNCFTNTHKYNVVERGKFSSIVQEQNFQLSGNVSDDAIQKIGNMLGAQFVISGSLDDVGDYYRLRLFVIAIESGERKSSTAVNIIKPVDQITFLLGKEENQQKNPISAPIDNIIGTTWSIYIPKESEEEDFGVFIFDANNVVRTDMFASNPVGGDKNRFEKGTWYFNQSEGKLLITIVGADDDIIIEFNNITKDKMEGIIRIYREVTKIRIINSSYAK